MKNDRTVQLTAKDGWSPLYVDGNVNGQFTVKTTPDGNKNGQFTVKTTPDGNKQQKFYWTVYAKRGDITVEK
ncbi:MAG: hypothetical protein HYT72_03720 [Candidatus Aenigmarchaeota archaeon]|nr:hypothetical protein [Candidatus Aenigmarchaeota archaeon]